MELGPTICPTRLDIASPVHLGDSFGKCHGRNPGVAKDQMASGDRSKYDGRGGGCDSV